MNYELAIEILNIKSDFTNNELKKAYYSHSLKYHPDKNSSEDAADKFRDGKLAFEFLKISKNIPNTEDDNVSSYKKLFSKCMQYLIPELDNDDKFINNTLKILLDSCKSVTLKIIEKMNKVRAIQVYNYLTKYKEIFNIDETLNNEILDIINKKIASDNIIILNPNINDILEDKIYKYSLNDKEYYIPLWHTEVTYDISGNDLILRCIPELDENLHIDNDNNIHINISGSLKKIFIDKEITFKIGEKIFKIASKELKIQEKQVYTIKKSGILIAHYDDLYSTLSRGDIIVYLTLIQ